MNYIVVLKNRIKMIELIIGNNGDINDEINKFYINLAGKKITINGYCVEEDVYTCVEHSEYVFPSSMISHLVTDCALSEYTLKEIAMIEKCTSQNISKIYTRAIKKIKNIFMKENITMESLYV